MTPEQRAQFIANVPDAEQRREAEKLWQVAHDADQSFIQVCLDRSVGTSTNVEENEAQLNAALDADSELKRLYDECELASRPWVLCAEYGEPLESDDGEVIRCALTGFLVHENDRYLIDPRTLECVLKSALGLPLGFIVGEFRSDDAPPLAIADDALSAAEAVG